MTNFTEKVLTSFIRDLQSGRIEKRSSDVTCEHMIHEFRELIKNRFPRQLVPFAIGDKLQQLCQASSKCLKPNQLIKMISTDKQPKLAKSVAQLCPTLLLQLNEDECDMLHEHSNDPKKPKDNKPTRSQMWGYGFLFMTINCCSALIGAALLPCLKQDYFTRVLQLCEGLAIGSLLSAAVFILIPEALDAHGSAMQYKALVIFAGIYLFYWSERGAKLYSLHRKVQRDKQLEMKPTPANNNHAIQKNNHAHSHSHAHGHNHASSDDKPKGKVASFAYLLLFGDSLHNFIDGIAIGGAFTQSIMTGITVTISVLCEELPHELGDFAVLIQAGMSWRKALTFNFLSQCLSYLGLVIGIAAGSSGGVGEYILALAAGMFLYISLVSIMNSMKISIESAEPEGVKAVLKVLLFQNIGFLIGVALLFTLSIFKDQISIGGGKAAHVH